MFKKSFEIAVDSYKIIFKNAIHLLLPFIIPCLLLVAMNYVTDFYNQLAISEKFSSAKYYSGHILFLIVDTLIYFALYFIVLFEAKCLVKILNNERYSVKEELLSIKQNWLLFLKLIIGVVLVANIVMYVIAHIIMFIKPLSIMPFESFIQTGINPVLYNDILQKTFGGFIYGGIKFVVNAFITFFVVIFVLQINNEEKKIDKHDLAAYFSTEGISTMLLSILFVKTPRILLYFIPYSIGYIFEVYVLQIIFAAVVPCCITMCIIDKKNKEKEKNRLGAEIIKDLI